MSAPEPFVNCESCGRRMRWEEKLGHVCPRGECDHASATGISPHDEDGSKVWRCDMCGWLYVSVPQENREQGTHRDVDVEVLLAAYVQIITCYEEDGVSFDEHVRDPSDPVSAAFDLVTGARR